MSKKVDDVWTISSDYSKVDPRVAAKIGVDAAIVLRTLYNLCRYKKLNRNVEWFQGSRTFWQTKLPWLSTSTFKRVITKLEERGLIEVRIDKQGNHYRVVQSSIVTLLQDESNGTGQDGASLGQNEPTPKNSLGQNDLTRQVKMNQPLGQNEPTLLSLNTPNLPPMSPPIFPARAEAGPDPEIQSKSRRGSGEQSQGALVFEAYALAYEQRYGCQPIRNAAVNSAAKKIYEQVGQEAMALVQHYVGMNKRWYLEKAHSLQACLGDLQAVRTAFVTGKTMTNTRAQELDKEQSFREVIYGIERNGVEEFELFEGIERPSDTFLASPKVLRERARLAAGEGNSDSPALLCETVPVAKPSRDS
jgi:hypothetical protein